MAVLLFLFWIIFNGRVTPEILVFGALITGGILLFACKALGYSLSTEMKMYRNTPVFILYVLNLILEIVKAACSVIKMILVSKEPEPVIIEFHSGFSTRLQNVLLADSITLTPGTITVFQEGDRFVVHCLRPEFAEGIEDSSFVRLLRRIK